MGDRVQKIKYVLKKNQYIYIFCKKIYFLLMYVKKILISNFYYLYYTLFKKFFSDRMVVYTCITGGYDNLRKLTVLHPRFDYICYTDCQDLLERKRFHVWEIRPLEKIKFDGREISDSACIQQRAHKILPHLILPEYNHSIYIDGNMDIVSRYIYIYRDTMVFLKHPSRDCVYDEIEACKKLNKDCDDILERVYEFYSSQKFPYHYGMIASGVMWRKHNDINVSEVMNSWFKQLLCISKRDQLSIMYVLWRIKPEYKILDVPYWKITDLAQHRK